MSLPLGQLDRTALCPCIVMQTAGLKIGCYVNLAWTNGDIRLRPVGTREL